MTNQVPTEAIEAADAVALAFEALLKRYPARAVAYSAMGIIQGLIDRLDGPGATEKAFREMTADDIQIEKGLH